MNLRNIRNSAVLGFFSLLLNITTGQAQEKFFRAIGTPHEPEVAVSWNRYYTYEGVVDIMQKIAKAHPDLAKLESIGKSFQGRDIYLLTISDFKTGDPSKKTCHVYRWEHTFQRNTGNRIFPLYRLVPYRNV